MEHLAQVGMLTMVKSFKIHVRQLRHTTCKRIAKGYLRNLRFSFSGKILHVYKFSNQPSPVGFFSQY